MLFFLLVVTNPEVRRVCNASSSVSSNSKILPTISSEGTSFFDKVAKEKNETNGALAAQTFNNRQIKYTIKLYSKTGR